MTFTPDTDLAFRKGVDLQSAKARVLALHAALDAAPPGAARAAMTGHVREGAPWQVVHPFGDIAAEEAAEAVWEPLRAAFGRWQRRPDIFIAGQNLIDDFASVWVLEMGHLAGWWRAPFAGIPPSGKLAMLRCATFHGIEGGRIARTALFLDMLDLVRQSGHWPLPPETGASGLAPGPRTHDGLVLGPRPAAEGRRTLKLVSDMIGDLLGTGLRSARAHQARWWAEDMCWWGPAGLGASHTIDGYRHAHPRHFQSGIELVRHEGHVARLAEGAYCGFFGWPSITVRATGGFMGLPAGGRSEMRIVDIYRREGDRLAENWIFIDLPHFLKLQGLDVLARMTELSTRP